MIREEYITIHHALHADQGVVTVNNIDYPILKTKKGCRYVTFEGVKIIQQDLFANSSFGMRARLGEKLTWVMCQPAWMLIDDSVINSFKNSTHVPRQQFQPAPADGVSENLRRSGDHRAA